MYDLCKILYEISQKSEIFLYQIYRNSEIIEKLISIEMLSEYNSEFLHSCVFHVINPTWPVFFFFDVIQERLLSSTDS